MELFQFIKWLIHVQAEFESETPYFYGTYEEENESFVQIKKVSSCLVQVQSVSVKGLSLTMQQFILYGQSKKQDMKQLLLIITQKQFQPTSRISDKLYFEPLTIEDVMHIIDLEQPKGVVVQFGGQTAINLAAELEEQRRKNS